MLLFAGCNQVMVSTPTVSGLPETRPAALTVAPTAQPGPTAASTPTTTVPLRLWLSPDLPHGFRSELKLPTGLLKAAEREQANLWLAIADESGDTLVETRWVYALAAPFPTLADSLAADDLRQLWQGLPGSKLEGSQILVSPDTLAVFESWWGQADAGSVQVSAETDLLTTAWQVGAGNVWAILPFEAIQPRWKVLRVDGISPLEQDFDARQYGLSVPLQVMGQAAAIEAARQAGLALTLPSNRQPDRLTVLALTGVTALSRQTAETMQREGNTYPGRDISEWLRTADLTHISNEVSFNSGCPAPGPARRDMRFCSAPEYIELLESIGTDIVELTGNHILDWGFEPFLDTLLMYKQRGWQVYGGGANLSDAQRSLLIEHNGNRLAFIGCSPSGPPTVWATIDTPGSAPCNLRELETRIARLRQEGWLPVVTLQHVETDGYLPAVAQGMPDFRRLARAGAVIVSGSQSHYPQTMTFVNDSFVHYGLGNLFFDQMDLLATRQGFIDRHFFYDGRYLGVELQTTLIEDYARPRPMTPDERATFLSTIFSLSQWNGE
jgi:hypothetical protein